jgi:hypothetical protein
MSLEHGLSCILLLAVEKKYVALHGCWEKNGKDAVSAGILL